MKAEERNHFNFFFADANSVTSGPPDERKWPLLVRSLPSLLIGLFKETKKLKSRFRRMVLVF
jgi:hypothetical protein